MYDGVRAFQLDIHRRPNEEDAFPVFHTNFGGDNRTVCDNVQQCAWVLSRWSDQNPGHLPVIIEFNAVDEPDQVRTCTYMSLYSHTAYVYMSSPTSCLTLFVTTFTRAHAHG